MQAVATAAIVSLALVASACSTVPSKDVELCRKIAAFANATADQAHAVKLTTDWGGVFTESDSPGEEVMAAKSCLHDAYEPGKVLCTYLLENTSTEFAAYNYRRVLSCIDVKVSWESPISEDDLPASAGSRTVNGKRLHSEVVVEYSNGAGVGPPVMSITARPQKAH